MTYLFCFGCVVFKFICSRTSTPDQKGVGRASLQEFESRLPKSKKILRHYVRCLPFRIVRVNTLYPPMGLTSLLFLLIVRYRALTTVLWVSTPRYLRQNSDLRPTPFWWGMHNSVVCPSRGKHSLTKTDRQGSVQITEERAKCSK